MPLSSTKARSCIARRSRSCVTIRKSSNATSPSSAPERPRGEAALCGAAFGAPLGILRGPSRRFDAFTSPVFLLIRPIPPLAWIPLAILWLGLGAGAKIMVIFFAAFVPSVINSHSGVRAIEPQLLEASQVLGTRGFRHIREVLVPGAMPMIFTGLRLSLQAAWTTLVAAELVGALAGLGRVLNVAQQDIYPAMILVAMAAVAMLGWATTRLLDVVESRAMPWLPAKA